MRLSRVSRTGSVVAIGLLPALMGAASAVADSAPATRLVSDFDRFCLEPMPDLDAVAQAASDPSWQPVTGEELAAYKPAMPAKFIAAWKQKTPGGERSLTVTQSDLDEEARASFPDFADGQSYACSLVLPADKTPPADLTAALTTLLTRPHDESYEEGPWTVINWQAVTAERTVLVYHYRPKTGQSGGLFSLVMIEKP